MQLAALGENLVHQGKFVEAEPLLRECLDIRHNKDPNGWLQFVTMSCLGVSLVGQRRFDEAELLLLGGYDGLQLRRADLKGDSAVYLTDAGNRLVTLYQAWGKPDWARAWEAKLRPPDHPDSFASRLNRAYDDESKGRWTEAERLRRAILDERRRTEEPGSVAVGDTLAALGENLVQQRRFGDAEPVLRECLEIRGTTYANSWPRFATMSYLGTLLGQRRYAEAEPLLLDGYDGLRLRKSELTDTWSRQFLAEAENRVVALYQAWGKPAQAGLGGEARPGRSARRRLRAAGHGRDRRPVDDGRAASPESRSAMGRPVMTTRFWCTRCGRSYEVPRSMAGRRVRARPAGTSSRSPIPSIGRTARAPPRPRARMPWTGGRTRGEAIDVATLGKPLAGGNR